jgi:hypothetical protein
MVQQPAWIDVTEGVERRLVECAHDRDTGYPSVMEDIYEADGKLRRHVIIVSHGRFDDTKHQSDDTQETQGGRAHRARKMPTRRDSTDVDWANGLNERPPLSPHQRLEIKQAIEEYDTAYEQFAKLYAAFNAPNLYTPDKQYRASIASSFVPEVYHVHVAYTALMHAYLRLIVLERDSWDAKSRCLGVESLFSAFRSFLAHEYREVVNWPIDLDTRLPSMKGYYERLKLQYELKISKVGMETHETTTNDDGAIEEVSDFEDDFEEDKRVSATRARRKDGTRRRGSSQRPRTGRKASQASSTSAQGLGGTRRRSG